MITFHFEVNASFLKYPSHPITVPKTQVDYARIDAESLGPELRIVCPDGTRVEGELYHGTAGYGPYYQLRVRPDARDALAALPHGTKLRVDIRRDGTATEARLTQV